MADGTGKEDGNSERELDNSLQGKAFIFQGVDRRSCGVNRRF